MSFVDLMVNFFLKKMYEKCMKNIPAICLLKIIARIFLALGNSIIESIWLILLSIVIMDKHSSLG